MLDHYLILPEDNSLVKPLILLFIQHDSWTQDPANKSHTWPTEHINRLSRKIKSWSLQMEKLKKKLYWGKSPRISKKTTVFSLFMWLWVSDHLFCMLTCNVYGRQESRNKALWDMAKKRPWQKLAKWWQRRRLLDSRRFKHAVERKGEGNKSQGKDNQN